VVDESSCADRQRMQVANADREPSDLLGDKGLCKLGSRCRVMFRLDDSRVFQRQLLALTDRPRHRVSSSAIGGRPAAPRTRALDRCCRKRFAGTGPLREWGKDSSIPPGAQEWFSSCARLQPGFYPTAISSVL